MVVGSQYKKVTQALRYLVSLSENDRVNILLLMKLIWAADRYHVRKYASFVTDPEYRALPKGPLNSTAYDIVDASNFLSEAQIEYSKKYVARSGNDIVGIASTETDYLSETDQEALSFAWTTFGAMNKFDVVDITHKYPEWSKFEPYFKNGASAQEVDVFDFFKNPGKDSFFAEDSDLLEASKSKFEENLSLRRLIKG